jgi:hypothetical protein
MAFAGAIGVARQQHAQLFKALADGGNGLREVQVALRRAAVGGSVRGRSIERVDATAGEHVGAGCKAGGAERRVISTSRPPLSGVSRSSSTVAAGRVATGSRWGCSSWLAWTALWAGRQEGRGHNASPSLMKRQPTMDRPPFSSAFTSRTAQVRRALAGLGWAWLLLSVVLAWLDREGRWIEPGREGVVLLKLWIFWAVWAVIPWWGAALLACASRPGAACGGWPGWGRWLWWPTAAWWSRAC